jgi:hypothetical protein
LTIRFLRRHLLPGATEWRHVVNTEPAAQMEPMPAVVANVNVGGVKPKCATPSFGVLPRLCSKCVSLINAHVIWLPLLTLLGVTCLNATSIAVRSDGNNGYAIAADSKRTQQTYNVVTGQILDETGVPICKICRLGTNGVFVASTNLGLVDLCPIAQRVKGESRAIEDATSVFVMEVEAQVRGALEHLSGEMLGRLTSSEAPDIIQSAIFSIEGGVAKYSIVLIRARRTNGSIEVEHNVETCPSGCRPYFTLGNKAAQEYIDTTPSLFQRGAMDFVSQVVSETARRSPQYVGGPVSVVTVGPFSVLMNEPGVCPNDH